MTGCTGQPGGGLVSIGSWTRSILLRTKIIDMSLDIVENRPVAICERPVGLHDKKKDVGRCGTLQGLADADRLNGLIRLAQAGGVPKS